MLIVFDKKKKLQFLDLILLSKTQAVYNAGKEKTNELNLHIFFRY